MSNKFAILFLVFFNSLIGVTHSESLITYVEKKMLGKIHNYEADEVYVVGVGLGHDSTKRSQGVGTLFKDAIELNKKDRNAFNKKLKELKYVNGSRILAKSSSYLLFLFKEKESDGIALHYDIINGPNTFKIFPAKKMSGNKMTIGGYITVISFNWEDYDQKKEESGKLNEFSRPFKVRVTMIEEWESSQLHRILLNMLRKAKEPKQ